MYAELAIVLALLVENVLRFIHLGFSYTGTPPRYRLTPGPYLSHGARPIQSAALLVRRRYVVLTRSPSHSPFALCSSLSLILPSRWRCRTRCGGHAVCGPLC